jgi:excisionase family DNA binding protein
MTEQERDPWLTYAQAAEIVGVHKNTLRSAARSGDLDITRMSRTLVRLRRSALDRWIEMRSQRLVGR